MIWVPLRLVSSILSYHGFLAATHRWSVRFILGAVTTYDLPNAKLVPI